MIDYQQKQISQNHCILLASLNDSSKKELFNYLHNSSIDFSTYHALKSESRQLEWLSVRYLLQNYFKQPINIVYDEHEKPWMKERPEEISISHSNHYIALSISTSAANGIDIEQISDRIFSVKDRFLVQEDEGYSCKTAEELCFLWSIKEACFKAYGKKDIYLKKNIRITQLNFQTNSSSALVIDKDTKVNYNLQLDKIDEHTLAYVLNP